MAGAKWEGIIGDFQIGLAHDDISEYAAAALPNGPVCWNRHAEKACGNTAAWRLGDNADGKDIRKLFSFVGQEQQRQRPHLKCAYQDKGDGESRLLTRRRQGSAWRGWNREAGSAGNCGAARGTADWEKSPIGLSSCLRVKPRRPCLASPCDALMLLCP